MNHFVWVDGSEVRLDSETPQFSFMGAGDFFRLISDGSCYSSGDEVGFENCELRFNDGLNFENACRKFVRFSRFMRHFEVE